MNTPRRHIHPREDWAAASMVPRSELEREVTRFLLVHHSASTNQYSEDAVAGFIGRVYKQHIAKGWADVAYNFFIDRYGGCWEGRAGSLAGPVVGDAAGGNQGYAQLVCLIGNHHEVPPTTDAIDALVDVLAWLAERDDVDPAPGAIVEFVSRGSNLWPAGETVSARTIAGHREMSRTACPGDHLCALLQYDVPVRVRNAVMRPPCRGI